MSEWETIETAPRDGSRLLLSSEIDGVNRVFIGGWDTHWTGDQWVAENVRVPSNFFPTHWMLLPEPPQ